MISILQENTNNGTTNVASFTVALLNPVTAGSSLHAICIAAGTGLTGCNCSDSVNGSYGSALSTTSTNSTERAMHFKFDGAAAGTTPTVTFTATGANFNFNWRGFIREIGQSAGYDVQAAQFQNGGNSGTDGVTTGNATPTFQPGLISAAISVYNGTPTVSAGTGFVLDTNPVSFTITEHLRYTSLAAKAATATTSSANTSLSVAAWFMESSGIPVILMGGMCL
jgi:hypothetical protein